MTDEPDPKDWMSLNEAVEHVMRSQQCSRRTAKRLIAKFARSGELAAIGINPETDEYEKIPAEVWPHEREL